MLFRGHIQRCFYRAPASRSAPSAPYEPNGSIAHSHHRLHGDYRRAPTEATRASAPREGSATSDAFPAVPSDGKTSVVWPSVSGSLGKPPDEHQWRELEKRVARCAVNATIEYLRKHEAGGGNGMRGSPRLAPALLVLLVMGACGLTVLYVESVRSSVVEATGNAAGSMLHSRAFREQAVSFLRRVAEEFLSSAETEELLRRKVEGLLVSSQPLLEEAIVTALQTKDVVNTSYAFSQEIATQLCKDEEVIERVGQLLLDAINTKTAVDGAAQWFVDLTQRQDTRVALQALLCEHVFADAKVQLEALNFCKNVTSRFLRDQETTRESVAFIKSLLERPALQAQLSQALVEVLKQSIYPRWLVGQQNLNFPRLPTRGDSGVRGSADDGMPSRFI
ncbi:sulfoacetate transporter SauU, putative [Babesia caballi]|uniref:Sulfoacetate transporter SauU, putative n=1 Tax=Babesia caballi TaxID=5871 RepID=A0AAV4LSH3_BABCB|nr:sulfoacetate transporter SauU, putative [Babesia caballi]